ncbi:MAG: hypothetical protein U0176_07765 [Bacteroidia bacterium]
MFELIKTLDKGDRSRVRKYAMLSRDDISPPHYLVLFDDLCKQEEPYEEKAFKEKFRKQPYYASFPQNKIYLYNLILDSLKGERKYAKQEKPKDLQIRERIEEAHLLKQKVLVDQSVKRLEKARKDAERYQYYEVQLDILKLLRSHTNEYPERNYSTSMQAILDQIEWVGEQIWINCKLLRLRDELFVAVRSGVVTDKVHAVHDQLIALREKMAPSPDRPVNVEACTNFHFAMSLYHIANQNALGAWEEVHQIYLTWRDLEDFREVRRLQYRRILYNYLGLSIAARRQEHIVEALDLLEKGQFQNPDERTEAQQDGAYIRLQYYLSFGQWEDALEVEAEFRAREEAWVKAPMSRNRVLAFLMSFARLNLMLGKEEAVKEYLSYFSEEHEQGIHDDKLAEARVWGVLNIYGRPDADIENAIRSARRFIGAKSKAPAYYDAFLKDLVAIMNRAVSENRAAWDELLENLDKAASQVPYDGGFYLMRAWAMAQRDGRPIRDYLD